MSGKRFSSCVVQRIALLFVAALCLVPATIQAEDKQPEQIICYNAQNVPADSLARMLEQAFGNKGVKVVSNDVSNCILITAPQAVVPTITDLLSSLDRAPKQLAIEVTFIELSAAQAGQIAKLSKDSAAAAKAVGQLVKDGAESINRFQLTTLENQLATVQTGFTKNILSSRTRTSTSGRPYPSSYTKRDFGTIVQVTGKANDRNELTLNLQFQSSQFVEPKQVAAQKGEPTPTELGHTVTATITTSIRVASGQPTLLSSIEQTGLTDGRLLMLLVSAAVTSKPQQASKTPTRKTTASNSRESTKVKETITVYSLRNAQAGQASKIIREMILDKNVRVTADVRSNSLVVTSSDQQAIAKIERC